MNRRNTLKLLAIGPAAAMLKGCGLNPVDIANAGAAGLIIKSQAKPVVYELTAYHDGDQEAIGRIAPSYEYLHGRWKVYEGLDQAAQVVPLILSRKALWDKAKGEAFAIESAVMDYAARTNQPLPALTMTFFGEVRTFIGVIDKAIASESKSTQVAVITKNLGRIALILGGLPQFAAVIPS